MILSHSGWRGVFAAQGGEESRTGEISKAHELISAGAAVVFAGYLYSLSGSTPMILVGSDTRPTGTAIAETMVSVLLEYNCRVSYAGVVAAPEIMAWARTFQDEKPGSCGFIYISASHNPIGHNGLKFGLSDGGVLPASETAKLIENFNLLMANFLSGKNLGIAKNGGYYSLAEYINNPLLLYRLPDTAAKCSFVMGQHKDAKKEALNAYFNFSNEVAWGAEAGFAEAFRQGLAERPLGVCCDFNGSARCVSIDRDFFASMGIQFEAINAQPGEIAHRIVPEGESLDPCCAFLEEQHRRNPAFVLGYVPDCDGDRGNLVIWDDTVQKARALEAQEVFALACIAELAQLAWGGLPLKTAVAVNDPTSLRIDRIAEAFGASVFRAEVGEANVVGLARKLREEGYTVRILGEGSAGGNITHPSAVRDPLHTVLAIAKLLSLKETPLQHTAAEKPGLFKLWCDASGQAQLYRAGFSLADIIASLPPFITTGAYSPEAVLRITRGHAALKNRYQNIFLRDWEERKGQLKTNYGIYSWEAAAYNGTEERKGIDNFGSAGKGGLKINFLNASNRAVASIWMRGSATEPVFRILADAEGNDRNTERELINWQRQMTLEADRDSSLS